MGFSPILEFGAEHHRIVVLGLGVEHADRLEADHRVHGYDAGFVLGLAWEDSSSFLAISDQLQR